MADAAAPLADGAPVDAEGTAQENGAASHYGAVIRIMLFYFASQALFGSRRQPASKPSASGPISPGGIGMNDQQPMRLRHENAWQPHQPFELRVYVSEDESFSAFGDSSALIWHARQLVYAEELKRESPWATLFPSSEAGGASTRALNVTLRTSSRVRANQSQLWAHVYVSKTGTSPEAANRSPDAASRQSSSEAHYPLMRLIKRPKLKPLKNLLSGEFKDNVSVVEAEEQNAQSELVPHWKGALPIQLVEDFSSYPPNGIPPQVRSALSIDPESGQYVPVLFISELWSLQEHMDPINETSTALQLQLSFSSTSLMRWQLSKQMQESMSLQANLYGDKAIDEMRRTLAETSPWLLALTGIVSLLHTLFDILAFKNDIAFWKQNKSMRGLSLGSMLLNLFFQSVIFLYLIDGGTSWMILFSSGMGLAIEVWKLRKAIKRVSLDRVAAGATGGWRVAGWTLPYKISVVAADSYRLSSTRKHDEEAMRYLSYLMYPLVVGYSSYSLCYESHKSWYSWVLGSVVGCVYTFGFIMMTPQLFINYKLKSTAHMPWKTFMYKALNTFVDDLFAFIIKMPTMHRLSCLRDDIVFAVYLYQRWCYGVDKKRANEFGQVETDEAEPPRERPVLAADTSLADAADAAEKKAL